MNNSNNLYKKQQYNRILNDSTILDTHRKINTSKTIETMNDCYWKNNAISIYCNTVRSMLLTKVDKWPNSNAFG